MDSCKTGILPVQTTFRRAPNEAGQSFVELSLVLIILALLFGGVLEFGFLMNNYLHVLDAAREGARFASSSNPFAEDGSNDPTFYQNAAITALRAMEPVALNGNLGDDIVISVLGVDSTPTITRYPDEDGWSLCDNHDYFAADLAGYVSTWNESDWTDCIPRSSRFTTADFAARLEASAPNNGNVMVEIFYNYPQLLKLPIFNNDFFSAIPDPIPVYIYAAMPCSMAEPH